MFSTTDSCRYCQCRAKIRWIDNLETGSRGEVGVPSLWKNKNIYTCDNWSSQPNHTSQRHIHYKQLLITGYIEEWIDNRKREKVLSSPYVCGSKEMCACFGSRIKMFTVIDLLKTGEGPGQILNEPGSSNIFSGELSAGPKDWSFIV
jgi:hypothetical protein